VKAVSRKAYKQRRQGDGEVAATIGNVPAPSLHKGRKVLDYISSQSDARELFMGKPQSLGRPLLADVPRAAYDLGHLRNIRPP